MRETPSGWWGLLVVVPVLLAALPGSPQNAKPRTEGSAPPAARRARAPERLGHTVRAGDSVWTIARRYGVSLEALARANRLVPGERLRPGRHLIIPSTGDPPRSQEPPSLAEIVLGPPPRAASVALAWPLSGPVGSPFGPRRDGWHGGIDLLAEPGTPIRAAAPGMVVTSGWEHAYGRVIKLWHHEELMTVYAHNQENYVQVGEWVERGQIIATVGRTGRATAPHVHFEVRLDGKKYDPRFWLPPPDGVDVATSPGRASATR